MNDLSRVPKECGGLTPTFDETRNHGLSNSYMSQYVPLDFGRKRCVPPPSIPLAGSVFSGLKVG